MQFEKSSYQINKNPTHHWLSVSDQTLLIREWKCWGSEGPTDVVRSRLASLWSSCAQVCWVPNLDSLVCRGGVALSGVSNPGAEICMQGKMSWKDGPGLVCFTDILPSQYVFVSLEVSWKVMEGHQRQLRGMWRGEYCAWGLIWWISKWNCHRPPPWNK